MVLDQDITVFVAPSEGSISVLASAVSFVDAKTESDEILTYGWGRGLVRVFAGRLMSRRIGQHCACDFKAIEHLLQGVSDACLMDGAC